MLWLVAVTLLVGVLGNALAWAYPWRVKGVIALGRDECARVAALPRADRSHALLELAPPGAWEGELAAELSDLSTEAEQVAVINVALSMAQHRLELGTTWPRSAVWLTTCGALMTLVVGFAIGGRGELLAVLPVALVAVAGCLWAGSIGRRLAARQRRRADSVVEALVGELAGRHVAMPVRRRHRAKRC